MLVTLHTRPSEAIMTEKQKREAIMLLVSKWKRRKTIILNNT